MKALGRSLDRAGRLEAGGGECESGEVAPSLCMSVDENLAEATIGIISGSEVDLLTADARLLGVTAAPVGKTFALRKPGDRGGGGPCPSSGPYRQGRALGEVRMRLP